MLLTRTEYKELYPLHYAVKYSNIKYKILRDAFKLYFSTFYQSNNEDNPIKQDLPNAQDDSGENILHVALKANRLRLAKFFIRMLGNQLDQSNKLDDTPLLVSHLKRLTKLTKLMINYNFNRESVINYNHEIPSYMKDPAMTETMEFIHRDDSISSLRSSAVHRLLSERESTTHKEHTTNLVSN
ncbi:ankyrin repeat domain-containing protein [Rickettsiales endosymbiont of Stachyamoeba lipophora]|uniref:ankyrin repeat domain-containing protein n=1 Tax=Rickettsiales endosymbiont of Stachyamoeba lipophora TaxID=2486578 RepID=UPI000F64BE01|nr:ankyrin repeat domain-containing protein [Rickettsiales endosymbiont of Stachyamoeba lipophora]AZL15813.1 hypothetical protein EF513_04545 [Rickettsiales endosymbiont of Stachyamoeba lipophora]